MRDLTEEIQHAVWKRETSEEVGGGEKLNCHPRGIQGMVPGHFSDLAAVKSVLEGVVDSEVHSGDQPLPGRKGGDQRRPGLKGPP